MKKEGGKTLNRDCREILSFLGAVRRRECLAATTEVFLRAAVVAAVVICLDTFVVERIIRYPWAGWVLALLGTTAFWIAFVAVGVTLLRPRPLARAGRAIEESQRGFGSDIVTSLALGPGLDDPSRPAGTSDSFVRALLGSTAERLAGQDPGKFVSWKPVRSWALRVLAAFLPVIFLLTFGNGISMTALRALGDPMVYWPLGKVVFDISPGSARVVRGGDLTVTAGISGPGAGTAALAFLEEGGAETEFLMERSSRERTFSREISDIGRSFRYRVTSAGALSPWYDVDVVDPPTAGSFEARYTYPAYTGLEPRRVEVTGDLEAHRGTAVSLEFSTSREIASGRILLGENAYEVTGTEGGRYGASFYLNGETGYSLDLEDREGFSRKRPLEYAIRYLPDRPPEIRILEPEGEVDLGPLTQIPVLFQGNDDYGIARISLLYRNSEGGEVRETVFSGPIRTAIGEEYLWDVSALEALPGSTVPVFLEATDNDTITGPKVSLSNSFTLLVPDPEEEHRKTEENIEDLIDDLVDLLADELELMARYGEQEEAAANWEEFSWEEAAENEELREKVGEAAEEIASMLEELEDQMAVDPLTRPETFFQLGVLERSFNEMQQLTMDPMEDLARSLDPRESTEGEVQQKSDFLERYAERMVEETEQMVLMAEEMQKERHMADVQERSRDMLDMQEEILRALEEMNSGDRKAAEEVLESLDRMEDMLREIMESLAKDSSELPEEFLNSDALKGMPLQETLDALDQIRKKLASGDLEGAKAAARELMKNLSEIMNSLQQAADEFDGRSAEAVSRLKSSTLPAMERLIAEQERILRRTEGLDNALRKKRIEAADNARKRGSREGEPEQPGGIPLPGGVPSGADRSEAEGLALSEEALGGETADLAGEAAALKAALPFLDPGIEGSLRGASKDMGEAAGSLGGTDTGGALPSERAALAKLMKARDQARQSLQSMEKMQGYRMGKGGIVYMPGRMPGGRMGLSSAPSRGTRSGGRLGTNVRSFRIPGKEDYEVPPLFRRDILESLREGYPEGYEERIRDYYHRIAE